MSHTVFSLFCVSSVVVNTHICHTPDLNPALPSCWQETETRVLWVGERIKQTVAVTDPNQQKHELLDDLKSAVVCFDWLVENASRYRMRPRRDPAPSRRSAARCPPERLFVVLFSTL